MHPLVLLTILSLLGVAALFIALAYYLHGIIRELEAIGGPITMFRRPANYLAKIRYGLRAIEVETGGIVPQVTRLNQGLSSILQGLRAIDSHLSETIVAVSGQKTT
ncbi:MAG: hypothetical protein ABIR28_06315 [Vicinamibacteria bacterium]